MTLNFMTKFLGGVATLFPERILLCFDYTQRNKYVEDMAIKHCVANNVDENAQIYSMQKDRYHDRFCDIKPKIHTIRKGKRWKIGMLIHFKIWLGEPYKSKTFPFAENAECKQCQDFEIRWYGNKKFPHSITIDGKELTTLDEWTVLAINDGFDNLTDFLFHFNKDMTGQIIGWTDYKY